MSVVEQHNSSSPAVSLGPAKAIVAMLTGLVVAVAPVLTATLADGVLSLNDGFLLGLAVLGGLGVPGLGVYLTPTKVSVPVPEAVAVVGDHKDAYDTGSGAYG